MAARSSPFRPYFDLNGTVSRRRAWSVMLVQLAIVVAFQVGLAAELPGIKWGFPILSVAVVAALVVLVQRLHDAGRTGYWALLAVIPVVGIVATLVILFLPSASGRKSRRAHPVARSLFGAGLVVIVMLGFARWFWTPYWIPSESMKSTLLVGDFVVAALYFGTAPQQGDVMVFRHPVNSKAYVSRLIGLPGDRVQMRDGVVYLNGLPAKTEPAGQFEEVFAEQGPMGTTPRCGNAPVGVGGICTRERLRETLPAGVTHDILNIDASFVDNTPLYSVPADSYFFLGDNRDNSFDSRFDPAVGGLGFVPAENLIGRVDRVIFSSAGRSLAYVWTWRSDRYFRAVQ